MSLKWSVFSRQQCHINYTNISELMRYWFIDVKMWHLYLMEHKIEIVKHLLTGPDCRERSCCVCHSLCVAAVAFVVVGPAWCTHERWFSCRWSLSYRCREVQTVWSLLQPVMKAGGRMGCAGCLFLRAIQVCSCGVCVCVRVCVCVCVCVCVKFPQCVRGLNERVKWWICHRALALCSMTAHSVPF